jgi:hypothetical protein
MIKKVNGININGSVGGTMSQSISVPSIGNLYSYTDISVDDPLWYVIGSSRFERKWLESGDLINFKANLTQTIRVSWQYQIGLFWATQSTSSFANFDINTPLGPTLLGYYQTPGTLTHVPFSRSLYFDSSSSLSVISSTNSYASDYGDVTSAYISSVTIPSGDGYFLIAAYYPSFGDPGRISDFIRLHYMTFESIYATRPSPFPNNPRNKNNILITKNSVGSNTDVTAGFVTNGSSVTGTTANTIINSINMTGFVVDGSLFRIETRCYKSGGVGAYTIRYYFNTSVSLTGATLIASRGIGAANLFHQYTRRVFVPKADGSGTGTEVINVNTGFYNEYSLTAAIDISNLALNWNSNPCYIICAVQLGSSSDTVTCEYMSIATY